MIKDTEARDVFDSLVSITFVNGKQLLFWQDRWIGGRSAWDLALKLLKTVTTRSVNARTVAQGLRTNSWAADLIRPLAEEESSRV
jgi:hypothetical protein